ncbi:hypothetical protein N7462_006499 [Penicillium macrosclerotiorum]|uniref:uncharacterized protein n=1 Tax=Penicillium macrosclerotiorum TaxID=303699 RepID=UPI00254807C4|nr:uncharacterized protein N7462_006499 [Penicillium macrosclerotiorum]KAJ5683334.1 hypothetical protein N7462_006499 [Penicillium macrosclerotiorum]
MNGGHWGLLGDGGGDWTSEPLPEPLAAPGGGRKDQRWTSRWASTGSAAMGRKGRPLAAFAATGPSLP